MTKLEWLSKTEADWLSATRVYDLGLYWSARKQFRKWRLFAAACCRRVMTLEPDSQFEVFAATAEQFADSFITWEEVKKIRRRLTSLRRGFERDEFVPTEARPNILNALNSATEKEAIDTLWVTRHVLFAFAPVSSLDSQARSEQAEREQIALARDIFGNPFRPVTFDSGWRTSTTTAIAKQMYDSRDFSAMPILADALQDAGCEVDDILNHCRDANATHVRGCWVVDLVLGFS